jgi:hypothetical protein
MPRHPTIRDTPLKPFICPSPHCNKKFRSNGGRTRHINAKHGGLHRIRKAHQSEESNHSSDVSSCPGLTRTPTPPTPHSLADSFYYFGAGIEDSDDVQVGNDISNASTPSPSPSRDTASASTSMDYHPYLNGKIKL